MSIIVLVLSALCLIAAFKIASVIYHYFLLRRTLKNIPCVPGSYPFIGNLILCMKMSEIERTMWYRQHLDMFPNGLYVMWIGIKPLIHIYNSEYLEIILSSTSHIGKGLPYDLLESWLGKGLLTSSGPQWFHDRRMIGPTFHFTILEQFAVIFSEKAEYLVKRFEEAIEKNPGKPIDIFPFILNSSLDIICETAMGVNINDRKFEIDYAATVERISVLTTQRFFRPWYWIDWLYYLVPTGKEYKKLLNTLHGFTKNVINKRKVARQMESNSAKLRNEQEESDTGKKKRKVFLDLLLDQNEKDDAPLSDDELRAQVDTIMFEGHDTTAVAMMWALFILGSQLKHQEKVHQELEEVFGDSQAPASLKELSQLKYLDRVMKEALRFAPSVPIILRKMEETIKIDKYTIPRGSIIALPIALTHRNPKDWPNPHVFDPDRFLPENSKHRNPYAYIPFSAGPRNCVGQKFAQLEKKIVLTAILRKWRVKSVKSIIELHCGGAIVLRPFEEVLMHFTPKK